MGNKQTCYNNQCYTIQEIANRIITSKLSNESYLHQFKHKLRPYFIGTSNEKKHTRYQGANSTNIEKWDGILRERLKEFL